jgi:plasmid stabilization system protein ParE
MAQPQIIYSPEARADILALATYIARIDGEARAELIVNRIDETIQVLAYMPAMGRPRFYLARAARVFAVSPWLVVYTPLPDLDGILVVRVVDGRRDLPAVLGKNRRRQRKT